MPAAVVTVGGGCISAVLMVFFFRCDGGYFLSAVLTIGGGCNCCSCNDGCLLQL